MEQNQDKITFKEGYWDNGQLKYKHQYLNGKEHGEQLAYHSNGQLHYKWQYLDGKEHGEQSIYGLNGELYYKSYYINDNYVSYEEWIKYNRNQKLNSIWNKIK